jgi:Cu(I)/Ag(I) efflux system membrane protein CusA/SilA
VGIAVETGVVMLLYLNEAWAKRHASVEKPTRADLENAIVEGALLRLRPKLMTVTTIIAALAPIMLIGGTGSEVMRRIAAPMIGGMVSATLLTLLVIPAGFLLAHRRKL